MAGNSPFVKAFNCPACGAPQTLRAFGQSSVFACESCGATIDVTKEPFSVLRAAQAAHAKPDIPLGTRGTFAGDQWEVIGYMIRCDSSRIYTWDEYLLFNPYKGYRWLMQMDGHWNYIEPVVKSPDVNWSMPSVSWNNATYDGRDYQLFLVDTATVKFVLGEFYWRVKVGDTVNIRDFISPPYVLSEEVDGSERIYSRGVYVYPSEIEAAFNISLETLPQSGVFPNQPAPFESSCGFVFGLTCFFLALLVAAQLGFISACANLRIFEATFRTNATDPIKTQLSSPFDIPAQGNVELRAYSPVENSWIELAFELIDTRTQAAYGNSMEVSYYHGYDSDGSWSEGGRNNSVLISSVPAGNYQLEIETSLDPNLPYADYQVSATYDVPYYGNFGFAFFMMLIPGVVILIARASFDKRRWENSSIGGDEE